MFERKVLVDGEPDIRALARHDAAEARRDDADDRTGLTVDADGASNRPGAAVEQRPPQPIAHDRDQRRAAQLVPSAEARTERW